MSDALLRITHTQPNDLSALIARLGLGIMIFPHGAQKALGWFGGNGFNATMGFFTEGLGVPWIFALAAILAEFLGGIGLIVGAFSRLAALAVGINMVVAALVVHWQYGFFMNWGGDQQGQGFEFHLLAVTLALVVIIRGGGALSVDHGIARRRA